MTRSLSPVLLAAVLALGSASMTVSAQTPVTPQIPADATLLAVSAQAEASRVPDIATLSVGVVTQAVDGNAAMRQNAEQMAKVMTAVKAAGIAERDIQTSGVSLSPQYRYEQNEAPKITGYQASNTVNIKVRDIPRLGEVMNALAEQGANQIYGPTFGIDRPDPVYDEARLAALKKAQARAETYATALGVRVRRIVSISEGGGGGFQPIMVKSMARMEDSAGAAPPISPGENSVSVNLDVVFELGK
jgi:hypothetical protein